MFSHINNSLQVDIPRRRDYYRQLAASSNRYNEEGLADKIEQWDTLRNQ